MNGTRWDVCGGGWDKAGAGVCLCVCEREKGS